MLLLVVTVVMVLLQLLLWSCAPQLLMVLQVLWEPYIVLDVSGGIAGRKPVIGWPQKFPVAYNQLWSNENQVLTSKVSSTIPREVLANGPTIVILGI